MVFEQSFATPLVPSPRIEGLSFYYPSERADEVWSALEIF